MWGPDTARKPHMLCRPSSRTLAVFFGQNCVWRQLITWGIQNITYGLQDENIIWNPFYRMTAFASGPVCVQWNFREYRYTAAGWQKDVTLIKTELKEYQNCFCGAAHRTGCDHPPLANSIVEIPPQVALVLATQVTSWPACTVVIVNTCGICWIAHCSIK